MDGKLEKLIFAEDVMTVEKANELLNKFNIHPLQVQEGKASDDPENPKYAIIMPRYNDTHYDILEDVHINDWTANECVQKKTHFIMGKHPKPVLDIKKDFRREQDRRMALEAINNNETYLEKKAEIDKICYDYDLYTFLSNANDSVSVFGRAAIQILREPIELEAVPSNVGNRTIPGSITGFKLLNSRRLGRIKVEKKSNKIIGVEYYDMKKVVGGQEVELDDNEKFIPIADLIYIANPMGNVSTNAQFTGISRIESIIHISQAKRIIMNKNIPEAALTHYAGVTFAKFPQDTDGSVITQWISDLARAAGRVFAHKQNVEVKHEKVDTDLDKYSALVELLDRAIIRAIGIPSFLVGYEQIANYANSEQVLIAWAEGELVFWRNWMQDILQKYLFGPLWNKAIGTNGNEEIAIDQEGYAQDETYTSLETEQEEKPEEPNPKEPAEVKKQLKILASDIKVAYEFQNISFLPKIEIINGLKVLKDMGVPLTDEMILRIAGYDEWIEQIMQNKKVEDAKKEKEKQKNFELMKENMANNQNQPNPNPNPFPAKNPFQSQQGQAEDKLFNIATKNAEQINQEKLKLLKLLEDKIREL